MKKTVFISIASLFFFTGCSSTGSMSSQKTSIVIPTLNDSREIASFNESQMVNLGVAAEITEKCYQKGYTSFEEYKDIARIYSDIIEDVDDYSAFSAGSKSVNDSNIRLNSKICRTEVPNILLYARDHYDNGQADIPNALEYLRNKTTFTDVVNGLNALNQGIQSNNEKILSVTPNNIYYPSINTNKKARNRTVTAYQRGNKTYYSNGTSSRKSGNNTFHSDGTSSMRSGNYVYHSDGTNSTRSGNYIYNSDGSKCLISNNTITCK